MRKNLKQLALGLVGMIAILGSCKKDETTPVISNAKVNVVHASPDAPGVDLLIDNVKKNNAALNFDQNTGYLTLEAGARNIKVNASGSATSVINANVTLVKDKNYTVIAANTLAKIEPIVIEDDLTAPAAGKAHVRFIHLSPDAPAVDLKAGTTLLFGNTAFKQSTSFIPVAAGAVTIDVYAAGTANKVLSVPVTLAAGKIYTVYAKNLVAGLGASLITNN